MESHIQIREFQESDRAALENIIRKTWNYDNFAAQKPPQRLQRPI